MVGPRSSSSALFETSTSSKEGYGDSLLVCSRCHPAQLSKFGRSDYGGEVHLANRRNAPEVSTFMN